MTVQDTLKSWMDNFAKGFSGEDEGYIEEPEEVIAYQTEGQLAMQPEIKPVVRNTVETGKNVVNGTFGKGNTEVIICEPREYKESVEFVKHSKDKKSIIVNLNLLDANDAVRLVDFLCGATHALNGNQRKISENVFIFTPMSVSLSAESQDDKMIKNAMWE